MNLTRRQFIAGSAFGIGVAACPALVSAATQAYKSAPTPALDYTEAFSQLGRMSYGATLPECSALIRNGLAAYVEAQLHPNDAADTLCNTRIHEATLHIQYKAAEKKPDEQKPGDKKQNKPPVEMKNTSYPGVNEDRRLTSLNQPVEALWPLSDNTVFMDGKERRRPAQEVRAATWIRATYSQWQLREVMVEFWHNHFNVNAFSDHRISATFPLYDTLMRQHCLGNFRDFLEAVAQSPAMLFYLNNVKSKASPANENYARELFELHTLGADHYYNNLYNRWREVPGALDGKPIGYIDQDVYEAARAFTGWTVEDGTNTGRGTIFPQTGKFVYFDAWHDNYQKRVLGTEFDPNAGPMADGRKVLDLIAAHPGTAEFLCRKLCRRFVSDTPPPALVKRAAQLWQDSLKAPDQIARVVRLILLSPEFAAAKSQKVKRPFEFAVSFLRITGAALYPTDALFDTLSGAGYRQFEWPTPTGHPDIASYWLNSNSTLTSWNLLESLFSNGFRTALFDLAAQTPPSIRSNRDIAIYWHQRLTGRSPDAETLALLLQFLPNHDADTTPDLRLSSMRLPLQELVTTIAMLPAFAVRG